MSRRRDNEGAEEERREAKEARNKRKKIKMVMREERLGEITKAMRAEEEERLERLGLQQREVATVRSGHEEQSKENIASSDSEECKVIIEEEDDEDPNNSGLHINDALNVRNAAGEVLVNVGHPDSDRDITLAPQLAAMAKPHQIGGIRFLYDNIVESEERYQGSQGFGCILAHSMGLGKTFQVVAFVDIFLGATPGNKVLCIVPINTIHNWVSEFNYWLPEQNKSSPISGKVACPVRRRHFPIHLLNDSLKSLPQRAAVIQAWQREGGVLLMGYELYRQLANKKARRRKAQRAGSSDVDEDDRNRSLLTEVQKAIVSPGPDLVICDEGHRIKNSHASISQALKLIKTKRRIVLTGYPLQNNLLEYWCMVDWVRPNFLGNKTEFSNMFERPIQNGQCVDSTSKDVRLMKHRAHVLHQQLKGFVQRRGHTVLRNSLPPKKEHVLFIRMTDTQRRLYRRFMDELIANRCVSNPLKAFAVCCKIWNHPDVLYSFLKKREEIDLDFDPEEVSLEDTTKNKEEPGQMAKKEEINYDWAQGMMNQYCPGKLENSNKLEVFMGILEETLAVGDRILLFSQSLLTLTLIEEFLRTKELTPSEEPWVVGRTYYRLDGSTPAVERERLINGFNTNQGVKLFLVSTRAGSLGVNLVGANRVVIFDASWNPCHDTQAVCRVYRYGQTKPTHVYRLVTDNSLEKKIYDRQVNKQGMADRIVDELNPDAHLSSRDVHSLICDEEEDPPVFKLDNNKIDAFGDPVMQALLHRHGPLFTKAPFMHESLLLDRKDSRLSSAEKKIAERSYKMERTSKITYSRPSYAAFYPKPGSGPATNLHNPGSSGYTRNRYYEHGKRLDTWMPSSAPRPVASVRPMPLNVPKPPAHKDPEMDVCGTLEYDFPTPSFSNVLAPPPEDPTQVTKTGSDWSKRKDCGWGQTDFGKTALEAMAAPHQPSTSNRSTSSALEALQTQGVGLQQVTVPRDITIPTGHDSTAISLKAGQTVMVIKTPKGIYIRQDDKIIKIKQPAAVQGLLGVQMVKDEWVSSGSS